MLGASPLATRPLAVLPSAAVIVDAAMSATASLTTSWVSSEVHAADASVGAALSSSFDSQTVTVIGRIWESTPSLTSAFDGVGRLMSSADASVTLALSTSFDSAFSEVLASDASIAAALSVAWQWQAYAGVDATASASLTPTWVSGATAGSTATSSPAMLCAFVSGATAGVVATTTDAASADWQGQAIGPVPTDFSTVLACVAAWSGQRLISTLKEDVRVGRTLTYSVNVGRSLTADVRVGE